MVDHEEARRVLQNVLAQSKARGSVSGEGAYFRSPQPKKQTIKRSSSVGAEDKKERKMSSEPTTVVLVDEGEASDEDAPLQRRKESSPAQPDAQLEELQNPTFEETHALWGEMDLVENIDSLILAHIVVSGPSS